MSALRILFIVTLISFGIAIFWNSVPLIKDTIHLILDPSVGKLLDYNINIGMIIITGIIMLIITLVQKFTVDNDTLRQLKSDQKKLQKDMKEFKNHPEKFMELQKESMKKAGEMFTLSMRSFSYTAIPIILFFRWFSDYFASFNPPLKIFGFFSWFWAYFLFSIVFSLIFRKMFKLP